MCGIGGFSLAREDALTCDRLALVKSLLTDLESRGRDAAGIGWRDAGTGQTYFSKDALPGRRFADTLDASVAHAAAAIVHTRFATQGSPQDPNNNHPIVLPGIVGVHNGCLVNDAELNVAVNHKSVGEVDSEAVFALITEGPKAFGTDDVADLLAMVEGTMAIAWLEVAEDGTGGPQPSLWLARGAGSPMYLGYSSGGSLIFASTEQAVRKASLAGGIPLAGRKVYCVNPGLVLRVAGGAIQETWTFKPQSAGIRPRSDYTAASRFEEPEVRAVARERSNPRRRLTDGRYVGGTQARRTRTTGHDEEFREWRERNARALADLEWDDTDGAVLAQDRATKRGEILFGNRKGK